MLDAFLLSLRARIAEFEHQRKSASNAERLIINGQIGLIQAIIHDYERIKSE